jgi:type I protein arginine methyltransferase
MGALSELFGTGIDGALRLRRAVSTHPLTRDLYRELANRNLFTDLYQHDRLLADGVRVEAYRRAIEKHVKPGDVVVDLGTGSGLLALMAGKAGAAKIYAIDHGPLTDTARAVAADNGLSNVEFQRVNSRRFSCAEKVDVILQEQIGDALFEEQMIENVGDLRDRLLKPGGKILPSRFELFVDPVQLREARPFSWEQVIAGIRFSALRKLGEEQPPTYRFKPLPPGDFERFLTRSESVMGFDLMSATTRDLPASIAYQRPVSAAGRFDGYCVHFRARFDDELEFTTSPFAPHTSWRNPLLRMEAREVRAGETLGLRLDAADWAEPKTWNWSAGS